MPNINWTATAVIIAVTVPFLNSWFQHWLRTRSENQKATANPALAQPSASTQAGSLPLGARRFITDKGLWFIIFVQFVAGSVAIMLIQALWPPKAFSSRFSVGLAALLFVCVQAFPWILKRLPTTHSRMFKVSGLLWDASQNPHCPTDETPLFVVEQRTDPTHGVYDKLKCPRCKSTFPMRDEQYGLTTLAMAKLNIQAGLRTGKISD